MTQQACFVNIGPRQRRARLMAGLAGLGVGALVVAGLMISGAPRSARLVALLPFWVGLLGVFQFREKT